MDKSIQAIMFKCASDCLHAAIDTGNHDEVAEVLRDARNSLHAAQIDPDQYADLVDDVRKAGYNW